MALSSAEGYSSLRERKTGTRMVKLPKVGADKKWSRELNQPAAERYGPCACICFRAYIKDGTGLSTWPVLLFKHLRVN